MADTPDETTIVETPVEAEVQETASVEETKVETPQEEAPAEETSPKEEAVKSEETEESPKAEETEPSEDDEVAKKRHNDEMAKQRIANSHKTRANVLKQVDESYAPKTQEQLIEEGMSESRAEIEALRSEMQFEKQKAYIADLNTGLKVDAEQVIRDHPVFDENSPSYDPTFTKEVQDAYAQAARLQVDENGIVLNAELGLADFYSRMAKIREGGNQKGQVDGQKDALKMLSRTETPGSTNTQSTEKSPADMTIEEMEAKYGVVRR